MYTPDSPFLPSIRGLLMPLHLLGVAAIFLPFTHLTSPGALIFLEIKGPVTVLDMFADGLFVGLFWLTLPLPFLVAACIWMLQLRSFIDAAMSRLALRLFTLAMWASLAAAPVLHVSLLGMRLGSTPQLSPGLTAFLVISASSVVGGASLIALAWINSRRRLYRPVVIHLGLRYAYVWGVGMSAIVFAISDELDFGGWLALGMCGVYAIEAIVMFVYGKRDASGSTSATLRYWLPRGDADPPPASPSAPTAATTCAAPSPPAGASAPSAGRRLRLRRGGVWARRRPSRRLVGFLLHHLLALCR